MMDEAKILGESIRMFPAVYTLVGFAVVFLLMTAIWKVMTIFINRWANSIAAPKMPICKTCPDHSTVQQFQIRQQHLNNFRTEYLQWVGVVLIELAHHSGITVPPAPVQRFEDEMAYPSDEF
jgi:hypothetical protein